MLEYLLWVFHNGCRVAKNGKICDACELKYEREIERCKRKIKGDKFKDSFDAFRKGLK